MMNANQSKEDQFELYDLNIVVEEINGLCTCNMAVGQSFEMKSGKVYVSEPDGFCLYAMNSALPLLPAKQRRNHPADWMETDSHVSCPDPACGLIMKIERSGERQLRHDDVSATPWDAMDQTSD